MQKCFPALGYLHFHHGFEGIESSGKGIYHGDAKFSGSHKASVEKILAVIDAVAHGLDMLLVEGSADCVTPEQQEKCRQPPFSRRLLLYNCKMAKFILI